MRIALTTLLATSLAAAPALATSKTHSAAPAPSCMKPADRAAFELEGLKSELTNIALSCGARDQYNAFMHAYQPTMAGNEKTLDTYFRRAFGKQATKAHDEYITNLSLSQEQEALKSGTAFCMVLPQMFDEVMALHDSTELVDYARSQALVQPIAFNECAAPPAAPARKWHSSKKKKAA